MTAPSFGRNTVWNIIEVLMSTLMLFILLRVMMASLGVEALGLWSLVLAATSLGRLADIGVTGGVGRYVASLTAAGADIDEVRGYIDTALIINAALYSALGVILYWPSLWALGLTLSGSHLADARALLPYAIAAFALQNVAGVVAAALTGFHRSDQKSMVMIGTLAVQGAVSFTLIGPFGLQGVATGQIVQYLLMLSIGWLLVTRLVCGHWTLALPHRFQRVAFRDLIGFGVRLQALNVAQLMFDPVVKFVFSAVGGLAALGLYELVQRGLFQVRQFVVAPTQNLTPMLVAAQYRSHAELDRVYQNALAALILVAAPAMAAMVVGAPLLSLLWLGRIDDGFILYSAIAAAGWTTNTLSAPAWHLGVATGRLRWNIIGAVMTATLALGLSWALGLAVGQFGVVLGAMTAMAAGCLLTWSLNTRRLGLPILPSPANWAIVTKRGVGILQRLGARRTS